MTDTDPSRTQPRGRKEVMTSVLAAARSLFAERGTDGVSIRDIAERANVNHALVHRHFGSKEDLRRAVLRADAIAFNELLSAADDPVQAARELFRSAAANPTFTRIIAQALLSGTDPTELVVRDGALASMVAQIHSESGAGMSLGQARVTVAAVGALSLGWLLFEPFLAEATGMSKTDRKGAINAVEDLLSQIVERRTDRS